MTAWVVRAGSQGENERWNLTEGFATVGWTEIGDLSSCTSPQEMRAAVDEAYAADPVRRRINSAGQLWAFRGGIQAGDLIVMPSKTQPGYLWFGTVTGDYVYAPGEPDPTRRHRVPVQWHDSPVSKTVVEQDLVYTLNGTLTVFRPSRNDAARRLAAIATTGRDPGSPEANDGAEAERVVADSSTDVTDPETAPTVVAIRDRIRAHVAAEFREHELTQLVAEILTVLGFHCEVSPPGPDGGVDIIGGTGPLGLDAPTLIVEVKSEATPIGARVLRGLHSAMTQHAADQALLVAWGGVTRPAELEFKRDRTKLRVWDAEALLGKLFETYDRLPAATRARIPLQQVWVLEED